MRARSAAPRFSTLLAVATLIASLLLTFRAWQVAEADIGQYGQARFATRVAEIKAAVLARMHAQEQVLRGARGLFAASESVSRTEWRAYFAALQLEKSYPGIQGIGFVQRFAPAELDAHIRAVRAEGFPDYTVHPSGRRGEYTAIVYLEPFDWRNRRAFGYDMFTEPVRRTAMAAARDTGDIAVSGKVVLVQETERDVQAGFLIYLPLYRRGAALATPAERQAALQGYVYSPLRMNDLMAGILGPTLADVNLRIYDGTAVSAAALMYDSHGARAPQPPADATYAALEAIEIGGHPWTLQFTALPGFAADLPTERPRLILRGGIVISLLIFVVVWSQATLRQRAAALAKKMTSALRESREQFLAVAETAHEAIVSADENSAVVYFNRAAEQVFGYSQAEVLGRPLTLFIPERFQAAHQAGFSRFLDTGESRVVGSSIEMTARRKDGGEFPVEISVAQWTTAKGRFFTAILRDISERMEADERIRRLNGELQQQVEQLAEVNRELESFSYSVSHDLRAPLRAIGGFATLLDEDYGQALDAEGRRRLGVIRDNSRKMSQLIDDLLAFSRLGRAALTRSPVDMNLLVQEVVEEIRESGDCPAAFVLGELPPAQGDRALLRQVWMNLVANAVKFSRTQSAPRIEVSGESAGGELRYCVRDNGVGFDMAYVGQLFGVFHRLHRAEDFPGTGVGLAIVQRIVARHGGRVWAEGEVGAGATFHFSLPAA